jgi:hypothetical protein
MATARRTWLLLLLPLLLAACQREPTAPGKVPVLPGLGQHQDKLELLRLRTAGNRVRVSLHKRGGSWRVAERGDWPADAGRVSQYLFVLSQAHRIEQKTANPALYARLGVEAISAPDASGSELELSGGGRHWRLLIGKEHPKFDSNYVRIDGQATSWLTDLPVGFDPDPSAWLDHRLVDLPLARVARVQVSERGAPVFALSHRDDRFRLDDAPSAAMHDSHQGDALAAVLDQLQFEQLEADDGRAVAERELLFTAVDGSRLRIWAWHAGEHLWIRLVADIDEAASADWRQRTHASADEQAKLLARIAEWNARFAGRRFQVPDSVAATLMLDHEQILAGDAKP